MSIRYKQETVQHGVSELKDCEIRWCKNKDSHPVYVNENIGDGSWRVGICRICAQKLGLKEGDDLPESHKVKAIIKS